MFLKFAFVVSLKFLNTHLPVECFQNLNRCGAVHCACDKCKRSKRNFYFTRQLLSYAWQAKLDHNARERLVLGGLHIKHYMGHEVAVTTTKHFTNRPWYLRLYLHSFSLIRWLLLNFHLFIKVKYHLNNFLQFHKMSH